MRPGTHALAQGVISVMQSGNFGQAFISAALGSLAASGFGAVADDCAGKAGGQIFFGALSGGIGAELTGGNFWQGAVIGGIVAGLNHAMHDLGDGPGPKKRSTKSVLATKKAATDAKKIGTSAEFIESLDKTLKGNSKMLGKIGKVGGYVAAGGQIAYDGAQYYNGEIGGYRFSFRVGTTITSVVVGAEVGSTLGGPYGFLAGVGIGGVGGVIEKAYDVVVPEIKGRYNNFVNSAVSNWMRNK